MKNVIVDTNVFVSALAGSRTCKKIIDLFTANAFKLIKISSDLFSEITTILTHPKFNFGWNDVEKILRFIKYRAIEVFPTEKVSVCRDPKDNLVLEYAIAGAVDFIITGDKDLLALKSFRKIPIITSTKFLKISKVV